MAPITKLELSALIQKEAEISKKISIKAIVMASFSTSKTACYTEFQIYVLLLLVTSKMLWQPLNTKSNSSTTSKSLSRDI